jgi:hypothetical protein
MELVELQVYLMVLLSGAEMVEAVLVKVVLLPELLAVLLY